MNLNPSDISEVTDDLGTLLVTSIAGVEMPVQRAPVMDLSRIDFEAPARRFKESKHKNTDLEVLDATIHAMLERFIRLRKTRADFAEKFEELLENYHAGSRNMEELFVELIEIFDNFAFDEIPAMSQYERGFLDSDHSFPLN